MNNRTLGRRAAFEALRRLAATAMLIALYVVLNRFVSISLPGLKIGFSVVCPMLAAMLYGPLTGAAVYAAGDLISALLFPFGPYHPGFTATAALMGLIWGIFCHPQPFGLYENPRFDFSDGKSRVKAILLTLVPALLNCLLLGLLVNTEWVAQLWGSRTYFGWLLYRLPEYAVMIPVNVLLASVCLPLAETLKKSGFVRRIR